MKKRLLGLFLILIGGLFSLSSCGNNKKTDNRKSIHERGNDRVCFFLYTDNKMSSRKMDYSILYRL